MRRIGFVVAWITLVGWLPAQTVSCPASGASPKRDPLDTIALREAQHALLVDPVPSMSGLTGVSQGLQQHTKPAPASTVTSAGELKSPHASEPLEFERYLRQIRPDNERPPDARSRGEQSSTSSSETSAPTSVVLLRRIIREHGDAAPPTAATQTSPASN